MTNKQFLLSGLFSWAILVFFGVGAINFLSYFGADLGLMSPVARMAFVLFSAILPYWLVSKFFRVELDRRSREWRRKKGIVEED